MIQKVIKSFKTLRNVFIPKSEFIKDKVECSVDDKKVNCNTFNESSWIGAPAPIQTPIDSWFTDVVTEEIKTEKQRTHEKMLEVAHSREEENRKKETKEPQNIHQMMYEMATKNWTTVAETQGGSENFQEGPGGWNSGTGHHQFRS